MQICKNRAATVTLRIVATVFLVFAVACGSDEEIICKENDDCKAGMQCQNGQCVTSVSGDSGKHPGPCRVELVKNGEPWGTEYYEYDSRKQKTAEKWDENNDGSFQEVSTLKHDAQGNLTEFIQDQNGDGVIERRSSWEYDTNGELVRLEMYRDGALDSVREYVNNNLGQCIEERFYREGHQISDIIYKYTYDAAGNIVVRLRELNGTSQKCESDFDAQGRRIRRECDDDLDGVLDSISVLERNSAGDVTKSMDDNDGDGIWDDVTAYTYTYDASGRQTSITTDKGGDGTIDDKTTYTYTTDAQGNETKTTTSNGTIVNTIVTDAAGNVLRSEGEYPLSDDIVKETYIYDCW